MNPERIINILRQGRHWGYVNHVGVIDHLFNSDREAFVRTLCGRKGVMLGYPNDHKVECKSCLKVLARES